MEKINNGVKAIAMSTPLTIYFLIKTIIERNYAMSGYMLLILIAGIFAINLWVKEWKCSKKYMTNMNT